MDLRKEVRNLSKRQLLALVTDLQREDPSLQEKIRHFIEQLRSSQNIVLRFSSWIRRGRPKRPGQKPGHPGITRAKPVQIDRIVEQTLTECPDCRQPLGESVDVIEHIQEDFIPAQAEATCFRRHRYWCSHCRKIHTAPYAPEEIPHSYIGPNALTQAVLLKYVHGLPFNKIRVCFRQMSGLTVSEGGFAQALQRVARWLDIETRELLQAIRTSPATHIDETGWKVTGVNHWLWAFVTDKLAYYRIDPSRGSVVPKEVLGQTYRGVVVSDFFSAYNRLKVRQQKCWVHLLREFRKEAATHFSEEFQGAHRAVRRIFLDARRLAGTRLNLPTVTVFRRYRLLSERLMNWGATPYRDKTLRRISGRILKHHHQLLTFLEVPGLPMDNNQAERLIRPHVILRNRSYQCRSPTGAATHAALMSWVQTLTLQGRAVGETLRSAYLHHRQGRLSPVLLSIR